MVGSKKKRTDRKQKRPGDVAGALLFVSSGVGSGRLHDIGRLRALLALDDLELNPIALSQRLESRTLDRAEVDKHIGAAVARNEPKAFRVVEPLHYAVDA